MAKLNSFRDLRVYQELRRLHLVVNEESLGFPKFETYELGSQLRRSSNAAAAILAEGWGNRGQKGLDGSYAAVIERADLTPAGG